jgi:hypothetical protein
MGETRNAYKISVGKSEVNTSLEKPRHTWEENVKMDRKKYDFDYQPVQDRVSGVLL